VGQQVVNAASGELLHPKNFNCSLPAVTSVVTSTLILQQQRTPQSILAWLLFVMMVPYLAVLKFMTLGLRKQRGVVACQKRQRKLPAVFDNRFTRTIQVCKQTQRPLFIQCA
jgi:hypothetical protein